MRAILIFVTAIVVGVLLTFRRDPKETDRDFQFTSEGRVLTLTALSEGDVRFIYGEAGPSPYALNEAPMRGLTLRKREDGFETAEVLVTVTKERLCFQVFRKDSGQLVEVCPENERALTLSAPSITHVYGLGSEFDTSGRFNWIGRQRQPGTDVGNKMVPFEGGAVGNALFPVMYALGEGDAGFAMVLDNTYAQTWDFRGQPWTAEVRGGVRRGHVLTGGGLPAWRSRVLARSGRPPLPPLKAFGLWMSEYGYESWAEPEGKITSLRGKGFPVDGVVLDLQWFGGVIDKSPQSPMGGLQWDLHRFPEPRLNIAAWREIGLGVVAIEEPFIAKEIKDYLSQQRVHEVLQSKRFLAEAAPGTAATIGPLWWGVGGLLDYTSREAADFWHDWKRKPLIEDGLMGHWTDLGEPEDFDVSASYQNGTLRHPDIHQIYNLRWSESIARGYIRHKLVQRPWILSRSGTLGSQKYGVAMWSGDIASNLDSLRAHILVQGHMSLSGMDYYGSDVGGFWRKSARSDMGETYTQWFAASSWMDVPLRPHTFNLSNTLETAPDRIGDLNSNRANLRTRYELIPYYYDIAHRAYREAWPLVAPLVYHFPSDMQARDLGDHKMIGPYILVAPVAQAGAQTRNVYLPAGYWYDFYTGDEVGSLGEWHEGLPLYRDGVFRIPAFVRAGAIVPTALVGDKARSSEDLKDLQLKIYPARERTRFVHYEDDGRTIAYQSGAETKITIDQEFTGERLRVKVQAQGVQRAPRTLWMHIMKPAKQVKVNGADVVEYEATPTGTRFAIMGWTGGYVDVDLRVR